MRGVLLHVLVVRARSARKIFGHAYFSENHAHCVRIQWLLQLYRSVNFENLYQGERDQESASYYYSQRRGSTSP